MAVLMREAIGDGLRRARTARRRTLREVSRSARVSLGYLSEVERGRKEPSSELLAAICEALDIALADLLVDAAGVLAGIPFVADHEPFPIGFRGDRRLVLADQAVATPYPANPVAPVPAGRSADVRAAA